MSSEKGVGDPLAARQLTRNAPPQRTVVINPRTIFMCKHFGKGVEKKTARQLTQLSEFREKEIMSTHLTDAHLTEIVSEQVLTKMWITSYFFTHFLFLFTFPTISIPSQ